MRRALIIPLTLVFLLLPSPVFATPAIVETSAWSTGAASSCSIASFGVAAGNNVVVLVIQPSADATASYTVADGTNGAYTEATTARSESNNREVNVHYFLNSAAATVTITVTQTSSVGDFYCVALEISTAASTTLAFDVGGTAANSATVDWVGASPGVTTQAQVIGFSLGAMASDTGTVTPAANWNAVGTMPINAMWAQSRISSSALATNQGAFTLTNARTGPGGLAFFKEVGSTPCLRSLMGVGC